MKAEYEIDQNIGRPKRNIKKVKYSDEVIDYKNKRKSKNAKGSEKHGHVENIGWRKVESQKREMEDEKKEGRKKSGFLSSLLQSVEKIVHG